MEYGNSNGLRDEHDNRDNENIQNNSICGSNAATAVAVTNVSSTDDMESQDEFGDDDDYSTEDDEDLMALYLADLYIPPYRADNEQKAKENKNTIPDFEKPSTSKQQPANAAGSESSENDEANVKIKERMFEKIIDCLSKNMHNDLDCLASLIKMMKWLRLPVEILRKLNIRNIFKIFHFARIITDSESDSTSDD